MKLEPNSDQLMMRDALARFLDTESSIARVRAALPGGFDARLWKGLGQQGALGVRVPESAGGLGLGVLDAALIVEEAGRTLVSGPIVEAIVAARLLAQLDPEDRTGLRDAVAAGEKVLTLAVRDAAEAPEQLITGGAIAEAVIARRGDTVVLVRPGAAREREQTLAATAIARLRLDGEAETLGQGAQAVQTFAAALEEWKILMSAALVGVAEEAIRLASAYACEREQFGRPIGAYQAISHPLAHHIVEIDAARMMVWRVLRAIVDGKPEAAADVSTLLWWATTKSQAALNQALHTFGGYGVTLEYDIHLFHVRATTWPLVLGDPESLLDEAGRRRFMGETAALPDVGEVSVDFDLGDEGVELAQELRAFFDRNMTPEVRAKAHFSWAGHDAGLQKKLGDAGLLFPSWPVSMGGKGLSRYAVEKLHKVWEDVGYTSMPTGTSNMIGYVMNRFGTDRLKDEVLAKVAAGEATCCLGFSEPHSGSDVFAAKTKATRVDADTWRIDGQKMFTTGGDIADYAILLTRTDPEATKHRGLTVFIVPLKADGVTIQEVKTLHDERTNITYYDGLMIPDAYRLGEVGGGASVMAASLEIEHGSSFKRYIVKSLEAAERIARKTKRNGVPMIEDVRVRARLARTAADYMASDVLHFRALWAGTEGKPNLAYGPASKMYSSEVLRSDALDLLNLTAPESLGDSDPDAAYINHVHRHAQIMVTYGGTSEVHRSMIAERRLGLPRTR